MKTNTTAANEAAKDLQIYNEVAKVAARAFEYIEIEPGQYTTTKILTAFKKYRARWTDDAPGVADPDGIAAVSVGSFSCSFPLQSAFDILDRMGTAYAIPTAARATFERAAEEAPTVAAFDVPTAAAAVVKAVAKKDTTSHAVTFAYVDTKRRALVGTNCNVLTVCALPGLTTTDDSRAGYLCAPALLKSGRVTIDANNVATDGHKVADCPDWLTFPNWFNIFPSVHDTDALTFDQKTRRALVKAIAAATKYADEEYNNGGRIKRVVISGENYAARLVISSRRETTPAPTAETPDPARTFEYFRTAVQLPDTLQRSFIFAINGPDFAALPAFNTLYITPDSVRPLLAVSEVSASLIVSKILPDDYESDVKTTDSRPRWSKPCDPLAALLSTTDESTAAADPEETNQETADTITTADETPAPVLVVSETVSDESTAAPAAENIENQETDDESDTAARDPLTIAAESEPKNDRPAVVIAANFARRARRWLAVAAAVLALFIVGATTNKSDTPARDPLTIAADTITTADETPAPVLVVSEAVSVETIAAPAADIESDRDTMSTRENKRETPRPRRHHHRANVTTSDTLTAPALVADTLETARNITETADTLTADTLQDAAEITAAPAADIESDTDDETPAPVVITTDESDDDTSAADPDETSDDESETSTTGTTTTGNGATTGTTTAPASGVIVGGVPVPVLILVL